MNELLDLLYKIKERPGMYIGYKSLTSLANYLDGYLHIMISPFLSVLKLSAEI